MKKQYQIILYLKSKIDSLFIPLQNMYEVWFLHVCCCLVWFNQFSWWKEVNKLSRNEMKQRPDGERFPESVWACGCGTLCEWVGLCGCGLFCPFSCYFLSSSVWHPSEGQTKHTWRTEEETEQGRKRSGLCNVIYLFNPFIFSLSVWPWFFSHSWFACVYLLVTISVLVTAAALIIRTQPLQNRPVKWFRSVEGDVPSSDCLLPSAQKRLSYNLSLCRHEHSHKKLQK